MVPAHPPFPTACSFEFQPADGSHTSILISESVEGLSVAETRQNAGSAVYAVRVSPAAALGGRKAPGATISATSICPDASVSDRRSLHDAPAAVTGLVRARLANTAITMAANEPEDTQSDR